MQEVYLCGICDHYHLIEWDGDCREDANRFTMDELDAKFGPDEWVEVDMPAGVANVKRFLKRE